MKVRRAKKQINNKRSWTNFDNLKRGRKTCARFNNDYMKLRGENFWTKKKSLVPKYLHRTMGKLD